MKTVVIANPRAANGRVGSNWAKYGRVVDDVFGSAEVRMTAGPRDATRLARQSIDEGFERIVVVGGDGTVNEAVNGMFDPSGASLGDVSLAYVPAGTGGDFARSVGLGDGRATRALRDAEDRLIDVGRAVLTGPDGSEVVRYFINISSFGVSGLIVDKVNSTTKILGGKASFMLGSFKGLMSYRNRRVRLRIDDTFEEDVVVTAVAVSNGRFFGGSMYVAPHAMLDDGLFDVIVIGGISTLYFARNSGRLYKGTHLSLPEIRELRGRVVTATPLDGDVLIDLDGEQPGRLPVRYEVLPKAVRMFSAWRDAKAIAKG